MISFVRLIFSNQLRNADVIYGYEVHGVLATLALRTFSSAIFVNRFQGTVLFPILSQKFFLKKFFGLLRKFDHYLALKSSCDLLIMTNDGTYGDEVVKRLAPKNISKLRFWRNGTIFEDVTQSRSLLRAELGISQDAMVYMTLSRLVPWKRVHRAIEAFACLQTQSPSATRRLVIVGDGESRPSLEELAKSLGIVESVVFVGQVPQTKVPNFFESADVFLSFYDLSNVGNPTLEALRFGKVIVTLNTGDTASVIADGRNGVLLKSFVTEVAAHEMLKIEKNSAHRKELSVGAQNSAKKLLWTWNERLNAEHSALAELVSQKNRL
jgi:glycosyltransferase involved in cell wall biosynthesis